MPIPHLRNRARFVLPIVFAAWVLTDLRQTACGQSPAGRWRGEWTSQSTGHHGPMRANIRDQHDGTYSARFSGRFFAVIPFTYRVDLVPTGWGGFKAEKQLGPIIGGYRMQTQFGPEAMSGSFQAAKDVGAVNMARVR